MPPCIDVYGLTRSRSVATIEQFLDAYAPAAREMHDVELMPYDEATANDTYCSAAELLAAMGNRESTTFSTIADAISFGVDNSAVAFTLRVPSRWTDRQVDCGAGVTFTFDGQLVFGLALDDSNERAEKLALANRLLDDLISSHECHRGLIAVERHAPLAETDFNDIRYALAVRP